MDFMTDETVCGRKFRVLNVIDVATRKLCGEVVDRRLPSTGVIECLNACAKKLVGIRKPSPATIATLKVSMPDKRRNVWK